MKCFTLGLAALLLLASGSQAWSDEIVFTNGDRLSGKIVSLVDGRLTFKSPMIGDLELDVVKLQTFSTSEVVEIHAADGTVVKDVVVKGDGRGFRTAGASRVGPQSFSMADTVALNPPPDETPGWHGDLTAGVHFERGNSITDEGNFSLNAERETDVNRVTFTASYDGERNTDADTRKSSTSDREIKFGVKYDYFFADRWHWFGTASGEKDGVTDLDLRFIGGGGLGQTWVKRPDFRFETEYGVTWVSENYSDSTRDEDYLSGAFLWRFEKTLPGLVANQLRLFSRLRWLPSLEDFFDIQNWWSETGIRSSITKNFFLEAKVVWEMDTEPSRGKERQDVDYYFSLGYSF